ncbi:hypothetical protein NQ176_g11369 [Zarea fungicola]|uniref:Uncharacterized protein n=1 Tax=Zarea fungicola TaxID=93591 RepID=A0ACC1MBP7_9HYPO|nr:hypothetical protein NQ176_g11369 [Lecanicillium fungicola]
MCDKKYEKGSSRDGESCVYHPGVPFFHDGAKGYTCCKRREFTFERFKAITGCETKSRHLFIGSGKKLKAAEAAAAEGRVQTVRHDYYQTPTNVIASFFLKKIDEAKSKIEFKESAVLLDLFTKDSPPKRYSTELPLYSTIDAEKSTYEVYGSKIELNLVKTEVSAWAVLRADERPTGEIPQVGKAVHI